MNHLACDIVHYTSILAICICVEFLLLACIENHVQFCSLFLLFGLSSEHHRFFLVRQIRNCLRHWSDIDQHLVNHHILQSWVGNAQRSIMTVWMWIQLNYGKRNVNGFGQRPRRTATQNREQIETKNKDICHYRLHSGLYIDEQIRLLEFNETNWLIYGWSARARALRMNGQMHGNWWAFIWTKTIKSSFVLCTTTLCVCDVCNAYWAIHFATAPTYVHCVKKCNWYVHTIGSHDTISSTRSTLGWWDGQSQSKPFSLTLQERCVYCATTTANINWLGPHSPLAHITDCICKCMCVAEEYQLLKSMRWAAGGLSNTSIRFERCATLFAI